MSEPKPRRRNHKIDPNEDVVTELFSHPSMGGMLSFLNVKPWDSPSSPTVDPDSQPTVCPDADLVVSQPLIESPPTVGPDSRHTVGQDSQPTVFRKPPAAERPSPPTVGRESPPTVGLVTTHRYKLSPLRTAQDGHSDLENRMYEALWDAAEPETITALGKTREITIGYDKAAKLARTDKQNAKKAIESLITKLGVERIGEADSCTRTGCRYRVFSYKAVVARRREAGYTACIRNRGGVQLWRSVGPDSRPTVDTEPPVSVDTEPPDTVGRESPVLKGFISSNSLARSSSSSVAAVLEELRVDGIEADDEWVHQLISRCKAVCPDVELEEILYFVHLKARYPGVKSSRTGFLLTAVPQCLQGESLRLHREVKAAARKAEKRQRLEAVQEARRILSQEHAEPWELEYAEVVLQYQPSEEGE